jgi:hypothetical protein
LGAEVYQQHPTRPAGMKLFAEAERYWRGTRAPFHPACSAFHSPA